MYVDVDIEVIFALINLSTGIKAVSVQWSGFWLDNLLSGHLSGKQFNVSFFLETIPKGSFKLYFMINLHNLPSHFRTSVGDQGLFQGHSGVG